MSTLLPEAERELRLQLFDQGHSYAEIARITGYSEGGIKSWFNKQGIKPYAAQKKAVKERIARMKQELPTLEAFVKAAEGHKGAVYYVVAELYGIGRSSAYDYWTELRRSGNANQSD